MTTPNLSLEERLTRIDARLTLIASVISTEIECPHTDTKEIWNGLRQMLDDVFEDFEPIARPPFPLSEWRPGEAPIAAWLARRASQMATKAAQ